MIVLILAKSLLLPEPLAPLATPLRLSAAQRRMQAALPCRERITLEADPSPFFSHSESLTDVLSNIGRRLEKM